MKNQDIADIFSQIADLMEILGKDPFRVSSYRRVARVLEDLAEPIEDVAAAGKLESLAGVGKSSAAKIQQYLAEGKIEAHAELLSKVPPELPGLLAVGGLGPKTVSRLWKQADVKSVSELRAALADGGERLPEVEGLGPKKISQLAQSLQFMDASAGRALLDEAERAAGPLMDLVAACKGARGVTPAGSLRRGRETVGDVDILCQATKAAAPKIIRAFSEAPGVERVLAAGETKGSVLLAGAGRIQADLRVVEGRSYGAALAYFTGSKAHNVRMRERAQKADLKLNEYGLFRGSRAVAGRTEKDIYDALGLPLVPPELREDHGELETAEAGSLPRLVDLGDIRGDLHMHTTASDGANTIEEMIEACARLGYKYLAVCDHSRSQIQANGLDERRLAAHAEAIRKTGRKFPGLLVLAGVEVDIFKDGELDFESDVLEELDFVTASPHSALHLGRQEATRRLIRAIEHPHVHCIGHPSGRLINSRPGMEIDIEAVAAAAAAHHVALEVNAHPARLDLRDTHIRAAIKAGAKIVINSDAHSADGLGLMKYGVTTARRGWAGTADVLNALPAEKLRKWLAK